MTLSVTLTLPSSFPLKVLLSSVTEAFEDKDKPNFAPSGLLAAATNTVKNADGMSTLHKEPSEARKPLAGWRLYVTSKSVRAFFSLSLPTSLTRPSDALLCPRRYALYLSPKCLPRRP